MSGLLLAAACGGSGGGSVVSDPGDAADGALATVLETARAGYDVPALAVVLVHDGAIVELAAVGKRVVGGDEDATDQDQWHLGSITKSMTSTLAAVLIERGLLDWDTTIAEVLLADIPDMHSAYHDVRVEQLMAHTGGLATDITRSDAFQAGAVDDSSPLSMIERRRAWTTDLLRLAPEAAAGTHLYSNANYIVLGTMLEAVTGQTWETLMERDLFAPLGMVNSGFGAPGTAGERTQPWGHAIGAGGWIPFDPGRIDADNALALGPAGTVHSTLRDVAAYLAMHLAGARGNDGLLQTATVIRLHTPQPGWDYGAGWVADPDGWSGNAAVWHNGSNGRWFAEARFSPTRNAAVLVVANARARDAVQDVMDIMIRRFEALPQ